MVDRFLFHIAGLDSWIEDVREHRWLPLFPDKLSRTLFDPEFLGSLPKAELSLAHELIGRLIVTVSHRLERGEGNPGRFDEEAPTDATE